MANTFKCISLSCRGLNSYDKRTKLYDWVSDNDIDIVCLQETHYIEPNVFKYDARWRGLAFHSFSDSPHGRGVSVLFKDKLSIDIINVHKSIDGRRILINFKRENEIYTIINVYAPNSENARIDFFKRLKTWISQYSSNDTNIILLGDFNCALSSQDRYSQTNNVNVDRSSRVLHELIEFIDVSDVWRLCNPNKSGFTWCDGENIPKSRIDYVFISNNFDMKLDKMYTRKPPSVNNTRMSDHLAIRFNFMENDFVRGSNYWKLNTSLVTDFNYCNAIRNMLLEYSDELESISDKHLRWERVKLLIKNASISYSKQKSFTVKQKIKKLEDEIEKMETNDSFLIDMNRKRDLEQELDNLYENKIKGAYVRSKARWIEKGEKNNSYFLRLEKIHQTTNVIKKLKGDNSEIYENNEVLKCMCDFYENLYKCSNIDQDNIDRFLEEIHTPSLTEQDKLFCDAFPTMDECGEAIKSMKNNKSPGFDGIPVEFYKIFWNDIKHYYYDSVAHSFDCEEMSFSQKLSIISLLYKKGSKEELKNYRPISLTDCDYKILAYVLARRLQTVIYKLVSEDQSAYIKGRYIGLNARMILDIFEFCEENEKDGILLFLDFQKAFDSVEWNFIFSVLRKFNFGENFIRWIEILYKNPIFRMKNNGYISKTCTITKGIRQGCPASAIIFILVAEILASKIRESNDIKGFTKGNLDKEIKIIQHADDATMPLADVESVENAVKIIEEFGSVSGMSLNIDKTECLLLGSLKNRYRNIFGIKVCSYTKCLGIYIGHDRDICVQKNWYDKIKDLEKILHVWKKRKLTIFGKTCIINTLALSKLYYSAAILKYPPNDVIKKINTVIYGFIWQKRDRIKRNTLIGKIDKGGIGIVDIESKFKALKAAWIPRIMFKKNTVNLFVSSFFMQQNVDCDFILKTNVTHFSEIKHLLQGIPQFYVEVLSAFNECKKITCNLTFDQFLSQPIWNNKLFKYNGKPLCYKSWIKSGILYVKELFDDNGFKNIEMFRDTLRFKNNWICEYNTLKRVFNRYCAIYDITRSKYINIKQTRYFIFLGNICECIFDKKCRFFCQILLERKFVKPHSERK